MKSLVIYESMYGNTRAVAEAVAEGLRTAGEATVVSTADAGKADLTDVDLLVVGGPTHLHGLPRLATRRSAAKAAESSHGRLVMEPGAEEETGLLTVLEDLPAGAGKAAAAFDTRLSGPVLLTGRASKPIAKGLRRRGYVRAVAPASFLVDRRDRMLDGELDRAVAWGKSLAAGRS
jgi:Flavodoxin